MNYVTDIKQAPLHVLEWIKDIRHVVLDMDGTIYTGKTLFPYTIAFLEKLRKWGIFS